MAKRTRVERELANLGDWTPEEREELELRLLDTLYDEKENVKDQAELIPLEGSSEKLREWSLNDGKIRGITTGYWTLDRMTAGLCGGDLDIIAAPSSTGKTLCAVNMMARQMFLGLKVVFITLEMSQLSILRRLYAIMTPKHFDQIMSQKPILVQKQDRIPYQSVRYSVEQAKKWGADVVYIDHLHYFSRNMINQAEGLGAITQEFKMVAKEFDIPIVLISQMRKTEGQRPTGDDLRGSALIKQDADIVLILDKLPEDPNDNIRVTLDKNRDRLIWKVGSETTLFKVGLDLIEQLYTSQTDMQWDVTGTPRGETESKRILFGE